LLLKWRLRHFPFSTELGTDPAVILEVLSGVRGPREGSEAMGVSLNRYYQLESRAMCGLIGALEPRPKGRHTTPEEQIAALEREKRRLEQEVGRHQALVRAAHRSLGVPTFAAAPKGGKVRGQGTEKAKAARRRRTVKRGSKLIAQLRRVSEPAAVREAAKPAPKPAEASS